MMPDFTTIAYVVQIFPYRTETFISREVKALSARGLNVITVANHAPDMDSISPEDMPLREQTDYVFPINPRRLLMIIFAHLTWIITNFPAYVYAMRLLFSEESKQPKVWLRNLMHFVGGVYLAWIVRKRGIQHLHAHYAINAASMALFMSILLDIPFSMTVHNILFTDRLLMKAKLKRAKFIACISHYSRDYILAEYLSIENLADKMPIVRCGLPLENFFLLKDSTELQNPPQILCASQLVERKGVRYLIEACNILKDDGYNFHCRIAGNGEELSALKNLAESLGLRENIEFVGTYTLDDLLRYFKEADILVLPCVVAQNGDRDGIPIVLMEAMAVGVPVISTSVSGIPELIESGHDGLLVEEKDAQSLAEAIKTLLQNPDLRTQFSQNAYTKIHDEYNMDISVQKLIDLFGRGAADDRH